MRNWTLDDDGTEIQVAFFADNNQIGGAIFPYEEGEGAEAFEAALECGYGWGPLMPSDEQGGGVH